MVIEVCVGEPVENGSSVIVIPFYDLVIEIVIPLWKIEPIVFFSEISKSSSLLQEYSAEASNIPNSNICKFIFMVFRFINSMPDYFLCEIS